MADDNIIGHVVSQSVVSVPRVLREVSLGDLVDFQIDSDVKPSSTPRLPLDHHQYFSGNRISGFVSSMVHYMGEYWIGIESSPNAEQEADLVYAQSVVVVDVLKESTPITGRG
jgi:hypothetical protein